MNKKRVLLLHIPVIHKGYLDLLDSYEAKIDKVYIFNNKVVKKFAESKPDIASLDPKQTKKFLSHLGFKNIDIIDFKKLRDLKSDSLFLINDDLGRAIRDHYFTDSDVEMLDIFLRWDRDKVFSEENLDVEASNSEFDQKLMKLAYDESQKSGDWWRQVGAVLVKDKEVIFKTYNAAMPSDHTCYQRGAVRDLMKVGEKPELANYAHAEQVLIARAASEGIKLKDTKLYITHFPCPVCAKLLALSGIKEIFFAEGSSVLLGKEILESRGIKIKRVIL